MAELIKGDALTPHIVVKPAVGGAGTVSLDQRIGTETLLKPQLQDRDDYPEANPYLRYMREMGQDWGVEDA